jgi:hypothetical protein
VKVTTDGDRFGDISSDELTRQFLTAVAGATPPVRASNLRVAGLERRALQKRLERFRRSSAATNDIELIRLARRRLADMGDALTRGVQRLTTIAHPRASAFADAAGLQTVIIDDWIELAHAPGDQGWSASQIHVTELAADTIFARGRAQSWLTEKRAFLRGRWQEVRRKSASLRELTPNPLKVDLIELAAAGTEDAPSCEIRVAAVDWQTSLALNARLDEPAFSAAANRTVRERWGTPTRIVERRGLPGQLVAHVVVLTSDRRFLVCRRRKEGVHDELGTWSLSMEERWSGRLCSLTDREGQVVQRARSADASPHELVTRGVSEELGISVRERDIRVLSWGLESSVLYPGFIALVQTDRPSWELDRLRTFADDSNELQYVSSIPADVSSTALLFSDTFAPLGLEGMRARWHRTSRARLFMALAQLLAGDGHGRERVLRHIGALR